MKFSFLLVMCWDVLAPSLALLESDVKGAFHAYRLWCWMPSRAEQTDTQTLRNNRKLKLFPFLFFCGLALQNMISQSQCLLNRMFSLYLQKQVLLFFRITSDVFICILRTI